MKRITKEEITAKIYTAAELYEKNLNNKNVLFVYEKKKEHQLCGFETRFLDRNFLHLTGIKYNGSAKHFYKDCLNKKLYMPAISINENKKTFTYLKLDVLINAMSINEVARSVGDFDFHREQVKVEKMVGNVSLCVGFSKFTNNGKEIKYYYPKTLLKDSVHYNVKKSNKIVAILSKSITDELYNEITYMAKDTTFARLFDNEEIGEMIDYENVHSKNSYCQTKIDDFFADMEKIAQFNQELMLSMKLKDEMVENTIAEKDETNENNIDYEFEDYDK